MHLKHLATAALLCSGSQVSALEATAPVTYVVTVTNGSRTPLSAGVAYVRNGQTAIATAGASSSPGLIQLCQMGMTSLRLQELKADASVRSAQIVNGHIEPNESTSFEITVDDPKTQSIQFETMYGKTKDVCATVSAGSHGLYALKNHVTTALTGKDSAIVTGAFTEPSLPSGQTYLDDAACASSPDAISCLRELSRPMTGTARVRPFSPYFASLQMLLERKYGADQTAALLFADSGAVTFEIKLKH